MIVNYFKITLRDFKRNPLYVSTEIGIRKVTGAEVFSIVTLLGKDFLKLVLFGFLVAVPYPGMECHGGWKALPITMGIPGKYLQWLD